MSGFRSRRSRGVLATGALGLAAGLILVATAAGGFSPAAGSPVGIDGSPYSVAIGDLNGDHRADMVTANVYTNTMSVLLGDGSGAFAQAAGSPLATADGPVSVALGDLNGDGKLDAAVAAANADVISVLLGTGDGGFGSPSSYAVDSFPLNVAIGDLNGDGHPDLVSANYFGASVSVLLGDGTGGFSAATSFATGSRMTTVAIGDLNGDGKPDLVAAGDFADTVSVLLGDGSGGFGAPSGFDTGHLVYSVAIGDVNGDGNPDVAATGVNAGDVSVLLGRGDGSLAAPTSFAVGSVPYSVALGDLNGDGKLDLVTANNDSQDVSVLLGLGDGSFGDALDIPLGDDPSQAVIANLDGDGKPDLAVATPTENTVSVLLNTFVLPLRTPPEAAPAPADTEAPSAPGALQGHFLAGSLILDWQAATDNVGVDHYELGLDTVLPLRSIPGGTEEASTRAFHRTGKSLYTVTAVDAAGNRSNPSGTVTVVPARRPAHAPRATPQWAWKLLAWQLRDGHAGRPATPRTLPAWYPAWKTWRQHPFRVVG